MMEQKWSTLVFSCEHAVNSLPELYQPHFIGKEESGRINSHEGIDFGAKQVAIHLSQALGCKLFMASTSRLLIDCNRTLTHSTCFSSISNALSAAEKEHIINTFYKPYRSSVTHYIKSLIEEGKQVVHLSIHSFTPSLHNIVRNTELGLLYDPKRPSEKKFVKKWQRLLQKHGGYLRTRLNYPYKGIEDGFTSELRMQFSDAHYLGIEVECNQALMLDEAHLQQVSQLLELSLKKMIKT